MAITVREVVRYALSVNPNSHAWLIIQADIYFGKWDTLALGVISVARLEGKACLIHSLLNF